MSAEVVERAEDYRWGSLWARRHGADALQDALADWPVDRSTQWTRLVNPPMGKAELDKMQQSLHRSRPLGTPQWTGQTASRLGMEHTLRSEGRPKNAEKS